jgi:D-aminopeptidase
VRARDLGLAVGRGQPGPKNAITDVAGIRVGHCTLIEGDGPLEVGRGPVRTGVTVILPHEGDPGSDPLFAGAHRLNGNGELTGLEWVRESGMLTSPVALTNTHSVGAVRDALVAEARARRADRRATWSLPVVGETYDGGLNDVDGQHVRPEHVRAAIDAADAGVPGEGSVGGGTGMICHGFKGGIGTASRVVAAEAGGFTVGALVQANHGRRERFRVNGLPVGELVDGSRVPLPTEGPGGPGGPGGGSIIVVVATDAPLLPAQCRRLAQRPGLGVARVGGTGEHGSGDFFLAFSTGNRGLSAVDEPPPGRFSVPVQALSTPYIDPLFDAAIEATEEAILNALLAAETMRGRDGNTAYGMPGELLVETLQRLAPG